jgi:hypothetical protein
MHQWPYVFLKGKSIVFCWRIDLGPSKGITDLSEFQARQNAYSQTYHATIDFSNGNRC